MFVKKLTVDDHDDRGYGGATEKVLQMQVIEIEMSQSGVQMWLLFNIHSWAAQGCIV